MTEAATITPVFGRRQSPRLRLEMPARLITLDRTCSVVLEDLSTTGAKVTLPGSHDFVVGVLRWMDFHAFADVRWRDGLTVGLEFASPLEMSVLDLTRQYAVEFVARPVEHNSGVRAC